MTYIMWSEVFVFLQNSALIYIESPARIRYEAVRIKMKSSNNSETVLVI